MSTTSLPLSPRAIGRIRSKEPPSTMNLDYIVPKALPDNAFSVSDFLDKALRSRGRNTIPLTQPDQHDNHIILQTAPREIPGRPDQPARTSGDSHPRLPDDRVSHGFLTKQLCIPSGLVQTIREKHHSGILGKFGSISPVIHTLLDAKGNPWDTSQNLGLPTIGKHSRRMPGQSVTDTTLGRVNHSHQCRDEIILAPFLDQALIHQPHPGSRGEVKCGIR